MKVTIPLKKIDMGVFDGNSMYGEVPIPRDTFISYIVIQNASQADRDVTSVNATWEMEAIITLTHSTEDYDIDHYQLLFRGDIKQEAKSAGTIPSTPSHLGYPGVRIPISTIIDLYDDPVITIFLGRDVTAVIKDLEAVIYYHDYIHPTTSSTELHKISEEIIGVETLLTTLTGDNYKNNGLRFSDCLYFADTVTANTTILTVPAGFLYEVTLFTCFTNTAAVWSLQRSTDTEALIRLTTALLVEYRNNFWLKAGERLYLEEHTGTANCVYTAHIMKWEIL